MTFDNYARYQNLNPADSILTIAKSIKFTGGGTNLRSIFKVMNKAYKRCIILSDMQNWMGSSTPTAEFKDYKEKYKCNPHIYSFDLNGHGTMQFPESQVCALAGFSDKIFDLMKILEQDKKALVNTIKNYIEF
jgi:hypothetical protein